MTSIRVFPDFELGKTYPIVTEYHQIIEIEGSVINEFVKRTKCTCNMRQRMLGDGCQHCNPELPIEIMQERIQELEAENKSM
jgi:hypothetical protein